VAGLMAQNPAHIESLPFILCNRPDRSLKRNDMGFSGLTMKVSKKDSSRRMPV
jgi:hypothetical protein